jgi:AcrR family transcriptional regulator
MGVQELKSQAMRDKICRAVTDCLVELGYADTSINRVVEQAGVSKGALQHHFRTKEDLMAATVTWLLPNASLERIQKIVRSKSGRMSSRELMYQWKKIVHTDEYRALLEILTNLRTHKRLKARVGPKLKALYENNSLIASSSYQSATGNKEDIEILIALHGCVIRGLLIFEEYIDDPEFISKIIQSWIDMVSPLLLPNEAESA